MFSLEDGSETETVPDAPEFLENVLYRMMTVTWYTVSEEGRLLANSFIMESTNSLGHSLSIRPLLG
jgi:hypothetical protein